MPLQDIEHLYKLVASGGAHFEEIVGLMRAVQTEVADIRKARMLAPDRPLKLEEREAAVLILGEVIDKLERIRKNQRQRTGPPEGEA